MTLTSRRRTNGRRNPGDWKRNIGDPMTHGTNPQPNKYGKGTPKKPRSRNR